MMRIDSETTKKEKKNKETHWLLKPISRPSPLLFLACYHNNLDADVQMQQLMICLWFFALMNLVASIPTKLSNPYSYNKNIIKIMMTIHEVKVGTNSGHASAFLLFLLWFMKKATAGNYLLRAYIFQSLHQTFATEFGLTKEIKIFKGILSYLVIK